MAWIDILTADMTGTWDGHVMADGWLAMMDGTRLRNSYDSGASQVRVSSFAGIQAALAGHNQYFVNNFASSISWVLVYAGYGHASVNACVEVRRMYCQVLDANNVWQWAFVGLPAWGKRIIGSDDASGVQGTQTKLPGGILRVQPGPAIMLPGETQSGRRGYELWPSDWDGSSGVAFHGAINRSLFAQMKAISFGAQVRLALWNDSGVDDRAASHFVTQIGNDPNSVPYPGARYISDAGVTSNTLGQGYPYGRFDGNSSQWKTIRSNDWTWVTCTTADGLWGYEADTPPPWGNWTPKWPYNKSPTYAITQAALAANPPPEPPGDTAPPPDPDPDPDPRIPLPSVGRWFAKLSGGENAWASKSFATTPASKIRRRRGAKLWS